MIFRFLLLLLFCGASFSNADACKDLEKWLGAISQSKKYTDISSWEGIEWDLKYSTINNVTGKDIYCGLKPMYLHQEAAAKLKKVLQQLKVRYPGYKLKIWDAIRPTSAQWHLWQVVKGTPLRKYVSSPKSVSTHSYGMALDVTLVDRNGNELDMGTNYDAFVPEAGVNYEAQAIKIGTLLPEQVRNRKMLRKLMVDAGWVSLPSEWWHFHAYTSKWIRANYTYPKQR